MLEISFPHFCCTFFIQFQNLSAVLLAVTSVQQIVSTLRSFYALLFHHCLSLSCWLAAHSLNWKHQMIMKILPVVVFHNQFFFHKMAFFNNSVAHVTTHSSYYYYYWRRRRRHRHRRFLLFSFILFFHSKLTRRTHFTQWNIIEFLYSKPLSWKKEEREREKERKCVERWMKGKIRRREDCCVTVVVGDCSYQFYKIWWRMIWTHSLGYPNH